MKQLLVEFIGFGDMRQQNFGYLQAWVKGKDYELLTFDLYEMEAHPDWIDWVKKAVKVMQGIDFTKYQVTLLGFSMGGVIASYLSTKFPIQKLILIAPAFKLYGVRQVLKYCHEFNFKEENFVKLPQRDRVLMEYSVELVKLINTLKPYQKKIQVPLLVIQGTADDVVPVSAGMQTVHVTAQRQKRLYLIPDGPHELLEDERYGRETFAMIDMYMTEVRL